MLVSALASGLTGRSRKRGGGIDADRGRYLEYLSRLGQSVAEVAMAQRASAMGRHPEPDTLWTLVGGARMWERSSSDADFCLVRVGVGTQPLARGWWHRSFPPRSFAIR